MKYLYEVMTTKIKISVWYFLTLCFFAGAGVVSLFEL